MYLRAETAAPQQSAHETHSTSRPGSTPPPDREALGSSPLKKWLKEVFPGVVSTVDNPALSWTITTEFEANLSY